MIQTEPTLVELAARSAWEDLYKECPLAEIHMDLTEEWEHFLEGFKRAMKYQKSITPWTDEDLKVIYNLGEMKGEKHEHVKFEHILEHYKELKANETGQ